jgi:hypothetical protein
VFIGQLFALGLFGADGAIFSGTDSTNLWLERQRLRAAGDAPRTPRRQSAGVAGRRAAPHRTQRLQPVIEGDYLVGIITLENLMRKLTTLSLRRPGAKAPTAGAAAQNR